MFKVLLTKVIMAETYNEDGSTSSSISERQRKKRNPILDPTEKLLTNPDNKAPSSIFIKRQKKLQKLMNEM